MSDAEQFKVARPRVAAGALFLDANGRVLLVHDTYKDHWDLPVACVGPGASPQQTRRREVREKLSITQEIGEHLVVDCASADGEGDRFLFICDGGPMVETNKVMLAGGALDDWSYIDTVILDDFAPTRLSHCIWTAISARLAGRAVYGEHGLTATTAPLGGGQGDE